jgi:hypothetical protein
MRRLSHALVLLGCAVAMLAFAATAAAEHGTRPHTPNMEALGHSPQPGSFLAPEGQRTVNSDLAFQGRQVFQGNYAGFRIIQADPNNPQQISFTRCNGDQGDIVVWRNILVRAWNTKRQDPRDCDGTTVPPLFEGVHVFDISNRHDPTLVKQLALPCGSHTITAAPDRAHNRLIVYSNNSSSTGCVDGTRPNDDPVGDFMEVIEVPLAHPENTNLLRREPLAGPHTDVRTGCHDIGVIQGQINLAACASADTVNVFDIGANMHPGGSIADPKLLYTLQEPGVGQAGTNGRWHSATFTWDGDVLVLGWEPGGGSEPECEETDPAVDKSAFFYNAHTGQKLGQWTLPRPQSAAENCTIHNYNVVPVRNHYVLVSGNYQAGTWVTEFTDPANPQTLGWSDPPPLVPTQLGGVWSSYWYNGFIWESDITTGLNVFRYTGPEVRGAHRFARLNPQTQEVSFR